jgi:hypothetical protein
MAQYQLTKEYIEKLAKTKGKTRGLLLKPVVPYLIEEKGKEAVDIINKRLKKFGYDLKLENISAFKWYPAPFIYTILLSVFEFFDWNEEKATEIGYKTLINSLPAKVMLRSFTSIEVAFKITPKIWKQYTTEGEMKVVEYDMDKKYALLRLSGHKKSFSIICPIIYNYMRGYLTRIVEIITKSKNVKVELTKCISNDDPYDEFKITWE